MVSPGAPRPTRRSTTIDPPPEACGAGGIAVLQPRDAPSTSMANILRQSASDVVSGFASSLESGSGCRHCSKSARADRPTPAETFRIIKIQTLLLARHVVGQESELQLVGNRPSMISLDVRDDDTGTVSGQALRRWLCRLACKPTRRTSSRSIAGKCNFPGCSAAMLAIMSFERPPAIDDDHAVARLSGTRILKLRRLEALAATAAG